MLKMREYQNNILIQLGIICVFALNADIVRGDSPTVKTLNGMLCGTTMPTRHGRDIYAFLGIPYAAPPLGELRFKVKISCFLFARRKHEVEKFHPWIEFDSTVT